jgi:septal ring factor EnvC (AmiA/AmiB activator)
LTPAAALLYGAALLDIGGAMDLESLKVLEGKIDQFVGQHEQVRGQHAALVRRLQDQEKQVAELQALVKQYEQERSEIRARLERILSRLEGLNLS